MDKFIAQENIRHFKALLSEQSDPKKRQTLLRLLSEEEAKLKVALGAAQVRPKEIKT